jgi:hypothetical protein
MSAAYWVLAFDGLLDDDYFITVNGRVVPVSEWDYRTGAWRKEWWAYNNEASGNSKFPMYSYQPVTCSGQGRLKLWWQDGIHGGKVRHDGPVQPGDVIRIGVSDTLKGDWSTAPWLLTFYDAADRPLGAWQGGSRRTGFWSDDGWEPVPWNPLPRWDPWPINRLRANGEFKVPDFSPRNGIPVCCPFDVAEQETFVEFLIGDPKAGEPGHYHLFDDDFRLTLNGKAPGDRVKFYDYTFDNGTVAHRGKNTFLPLWYCLGWPNDPPVTTNPYPTNRYALISSTDLRRNSGWYLGNDTTPPLVRYYGRLRAGDVFAVEAFNGWRGGHMTPWTARMVFRGREVFRQTCGSHAELPVLDENPPTPFYDRAAVWQYAPNGAFMVPGIPGWTQAQHPRLPGAALEVEFTGNLDDDAAVFLNGKPITGHLELWDYETGQWRDTWHVYNFTDYPQPLPYPTGSRQPVTSSDLQRRAGWWGAWSNPEGAKFYRMRYTGPLSPQDQVKVYAVDIIGGGYVTRQWKARLIVNGEVEHAWSGGRDKSGYSGTGDYIDLTPAVPPPGREFLHYYPLGGFAVPGLRSNGIAACCLNDFAQNDTPPTPPTPQPVPRLDVTGTPDPARQAVSLSWRVEDPSETVNDATLTTYRIYRDGNLIATVSGQEFPDNSPSWGQHAYAIQAYTADGVWRLTGSASVKLEAVAPPYYPALPPPSAVSAIADNDHQIIKVGWSEVYQAVSYNVYKAGNPDGPYGFLATTVALTVSDAEVARGVTYYYKVQTASNPPATDEPPLSLWAQAWLDRIVNNLLAEQSTSVIDEAGEVAEELLDLTGEDGYRLVTENSDA